MPIKSFEDQLMLIHEWSYCDDKQVSRQISDTPLDGWCTHLDTEEDTLLVLLEDSRMQLASQVVHRVAWAEASCISDSKSSRHLVGQA